VSKNLKNSFTHQHQFFSRGQPVSKEFPGFVRYQSRSTKKDANLYGIYCPLCHGNPNKDKKIEKDIWLGKVIDKDKGIFYNKSRKIFNFSTDTGFQDLSPSELEMYKKLLDNTKKTSNQNVERISNNNQLSIDFGDIYVVNQFLSDSGLLKIFHHANPDDSDTLNSLLLYRILTKESNRFAFGWWNETYAKYLYPNAKLHSQQISNFLANLGDEIIFRRYIIEHINHIKGLTPNYFILIDSTGLPNNINIPITAFSTHNNVGSNQIRLIFVVESNTGLPVYYRYVAGNIVDVSTLRMVISELKEYKIKVNRAILDAGYFSIDNIMNLCKNEIPFITRMPEKLNLYTDLVDKFFPNLQTKENYVLYNGRHLFIKKTNIRITDDKIKAYAYVCLDMNEAKKSHDNFLEKRIQHVDNIEYQQSKKSFGTFIILSTVNLSIHELLPGYYARQGVEQIFDYLKNEIDILPLRVHSEKTFAGHILISFMALTSYITFNNSLKEKKLTAITALNNLSRYHCRVYKNRLYPDVANKAVNDVCKALKITIPKYIKIKIN
jgi:hypothetical protein